VAKPARLFFIRCNGDGSWLTTREPKGTVYAFAPRDPMLVTGPIGNMGGAYELIATPWTVETWPDFQGENAAEVAKLNALLVTRLAQHDGCSRFGTRDLNILANMAAKQLLDAISEAKAALVGDSNDAEHDALVSIVRALGMELPDCTCDEGPTARGHHDKTCPSAAWEGGK
jgi:hypothetical protein